MARDVLEFVVFWKPSKENASRRRKWSVPNTTGWPSEMRSGFGSLEVIGGCGWWERSKSQTGQAHERIAGEVLEGGSKKKELLKGHL